MDTPKRRVKRSSRKRKSPKVFVPQTFITKTTYGKRKQRKQRENPTKRPKIHGNVKCERDIRRMAAERAKPAIEYANAIHKFVIYIIQINSQFTSCTHTQSFLLCYSHIQSVRRSMQEHRAEAGRYKEMNKKAVARVQKAMSTNHDLSERNVTLSQLLRQKQKSKVFVEKHAHEEREKLQLTNKRLREKNESLQNSLYSKQKALARCTNKYINIKKEINRMRSVLFDLLLLPMQYSLHLINVR